MTPLKLLPRFRRAYRELDALAAREQWMRADIESFQLARVNHLWRHARATVPYYQKLAATLGLPESFESLAEFSARLPVLTRATVQTDGGQLLSRQRSRGSWQVTGGSTGRPARVFWGVDAHLEQLRARYRYLSTWGIDIFDRTAYLWGQRGSLSPGIAGRLQRQSQWLADRLRRRLRCSAYQLSPADLRTYLGRIERYGPSCLYGYSTAVYLLAREALEHQFACETLKLVVLTSEPASRRAIATIEEAFRAPVSLEYGSMECGFIAGQVPGGGLLVREDIVLLETQPRVDGRCDILVTVLTNAAFPLLRYAIGDTTDCPHQRPARGFARLHNVVGRSNDLLVTATGQFLHPAPLESLFEAYPYIRRYCVRQRDDGSVSVCLELADDTCPIDIGSLRDRIAQLLEGYPVSVDCASSLPLTGAGKHRWISSSVVVAGNDFSRDVPSHTQEAYLS